MEMSSMKLLRAKALLEKEYPSALAVLSNMSLKQAASTIEEIVFEGTSMSS